MCPNNVVVSCQCPSTGSTGNVLTSTVPVSNNASSHRTLVRFAAFGNTLSHCAARVCNSMITTSGNENNGSTT